MKPRLTDAVRRALRADRSRALPIHIVITAHDLAADQRTLSMRETLRSR